MNSPMIEIAGRQVGGGAPRYIVAEIGVNHGGKVDAAIERIEAAKETGVDSVTALVDIAAGATITRGMLAVKRPGTGIAPDDMQKVVERRAARFIPADETMSWDMLS